jgi:hypothetical protein
MEQNSGEESVAQMPFAFAFFSSLLYWKLQGKVYMDTEIILQGVKHVGSMVLQNSLSRYCCQGLNSYCVVTDYHVYTWLWFESIK